jgi:hypothetical protein
MVLDVALHMAGPGLTALGAEFGLPHPRLGVERQIMVMESGAAQRGLARKEIKLMEHRACSS